jgi:alpha-beta hydrolase superfamily lysophospholipase
MAADQHHDLPYFERVLSAHHLTPSLPPRGLIVVFGGFDSYIEEWLPMLVALRDAGQDVVAFDGPGQGTASAI